MGAVDEVKDIAEARHAHAPLNQSSRGEDDDGAEHRRQRIGNKLRDGIGHGNSHMLHKEVERLGHDQCHEQRHEQTRASQIAGGDKRGAVLGMTQRDQEEQDTDGRNRRRKALVLKHLAVGVRDRGTHVDGAEVHGNDQHIANRCRHAGAGKERLQRRNRQSVDNRQQRHAQRNGHGRHHAGHKTLYDLKAAHLVGNGAHMLLEEALHRIENAHFVSTDPLLTVHVVVKREIAADSFPPMTKEKYGYALRSRVRSQSPTSGLSGRVMLSVAARMSSPPRYAPVRGLNHRLA